MKEERQTLMLEFADLIRKETSSWRQKAIIWAKEGDCDLSFFHSVASGRKSKNTIGSLESDGREIVWKEKDIEEEVLSLFFSSKVTPKPFVHGID